MTRIVILGDLCGLGEQLRRHIPGSALIDRVSLLDHPALLRADLIVSLSARLSARLLYWPHVWRGRYVAYATGSDLRELAMENTPQGRRAAAYFRGARMVILNNFDRPMLAAAERLGLRNVYHHKFTIEPLSLGDLKEPVQTFVAAQERVAYMPATQHFSVKGNDTAWNALARKRCGVIAREHGPDVAAARCLSRNLDVLWLPTVSSGTFRAICRKVDVVLDQFRLGTLGMIALEAMYEGAPVITWHDDTLPALYATQPLVLTLEALNWSRHALQAAGRASAEWVRREHGPDEIEKLAGAIQACL